MKTSNGDNLVKIEIDDFIVQKFKIEYEDGSVELDNSALSPIRYLVMENNIQVMITIAQITIFEGDLCYQKSEVSNLIIHEFILDNEVVQSPYTLHQLREVICEHLQVIEKTNFTVKRKSIPLLNMLFEYYNLWKKIDYLNIDLFNTNTNYKQYSIVVKEQTFQIKSELAKILDDFHEYCQKTI